MAIGRHVKHKIITQQCAMDDEIFVVTYQPKKKKGKQRTVSPLRDSSECAMGPSKWKGPGRALPVQQDLGSLEADAWWT